MIESDSFDYEGHSFTGATAKGKKSLVETNRIMKTNRDFEERLHAEFGKSDSPSFVHLYAGEEAAGTGIMIHLNEKDRIASTHHGHGHCIAKGVNTSGMMADIYGKVSGSCRGDGGVAIFFVGYGASNKGAFLESLGLAAMWNLPAIFVVQNNGYAGSTSSDYVVSVDSFVDRAAGFGLPGISVDGWLSNINTLGGAATVYALDVPGHCHSTKALANPSRSAMTTALSEFMKKVGIDGAHLAGHSMGDAIAMLMASECPGKVDSLTLICPAGRGKEVGGYVDAFLAAEDHKELKPVLEQLFADKNLVSRQLVDDALKYKWLDGVEPLLKDLSASFLAGQTQQGQPSARLAAGEAPPTLFIWGKQDEVIPHSHA